MTEAQMERVLAATRRNGAGMLDLDEANIAQAATKEPHRHGTCIRVPVLVLGQDQGWAERERAVTMALVPLRHPAMARS